MRLRALRHTAAPTDSRILAKRCYEFLIMGPGARSQVCGDEEPKETEHLGLARVARGRRKRGENCEGHDPWWTIPETERLQMHTLTHPSSQLRLKV